MQKINWGKMENFHILYLNRGKAGGIISHVGPISHTSIILGKGCSCPKNQRYILRFSQYHRLRRQWAFRVSASPRWPASARGKP